MNQREFLSHDVLPPFLPEYANILILGSFPSPKSREYGFYYGHPQNRFWQTLAAVFDDVLPTSLDDKKAFLTRHGIALWDVIQSCSIIGASDSSIEDVVYNDISAIAKRLPLRLIVTTGKKADSLYRKRFKKEPVLTSISYRNLPSTSPANARMRLPDLVKAYSVLKDEK